MKNLQIKYISKKEGKKNDTVKKKSFEFIHLIYERKLTVIIIFSEDFYIFYYYYYYKH